RFHRVETSRGRTHEGTGIGLALIQELVKLHGGTLGVRSVEGGGALGRCGSVRAWTSFPHAPLDRHRRGIEPWADTGRAPDASGRSVREGPGRRRPAGRL
ncbi:hypothetical protein D7V97_32745, partial [Corallococcus sp. CA053C]